VRPADAVLAAHSAMALARHAPKSGARVLDSGCGSGETTLDLGRLVGSKGSVVGVDACAASIELARARARAARAANVTFVTGDAQNVTLETEPFDVAFARIGTAFFDDAEVALRMLRGSLRRGGRLLNLAWRALNANPWAALPREIALRRRLRPRQDRPSCLPRPFSMADHGSARSILECAGYVDVVVTIIDSPIALGTDLDEAIASLLDLGRAGEGEIVGETGEVERASVDARVADLRAVLAPYVTPRGVVMGSSSWCITATNPS
jgi:SAM-dependent methyltransferase